MALFKFVKLINADKPIDVYNYGKMSRDFTYVEDIVESIRLLISEPPSIEKDLIRKIQNDSISTVAPWRIVNIGNSNPVELEKFIEQIEKNLGQKAKKNYLEM